MRSAQRRKRNEAKRKKGGRYGLLFKIFLPTILVGLLYLLIKIDTAYWNGHDKFGFAFKKDNGDVGVTVLDPKLTEATTFNIPGDTEVSVAENYGTLRLKNVWQLGLNEKKGGRLLSETVTKNFLFPVFAWSDDTGESIGQGKLSGILKFIFSRPETNIPLGDRISIGLFALKVPALGRNEVDLGKSQFVKKKILSDGAAGFAVSGPIPEQLTVYFTDNNMADGNIGVGISDATGAFGVADKVGQIVEVMGGKIVSIDRKSQTGDTDCLVLGADRKIIKKFTTLFGCKRGSESTNFDVEIRLGTAFAKRF